MEVGKRSKKETEMRNEKGTEVEKVRKQKKMKQEEE